MLGLFAEVDWAYLAGCGVIVKLYNIRSRRHGKSYGISGPHQKEGQEKAKSF